jgi:hypothetical protein
MAEKCEGGDSEIVYERVPPPFHFLIPYPLKSGNGGFGRLRRLVWAAGGGPTATP